MRLHGGLNELDHMLSAVPVHSITIDIVQIDLIDRLHPGSNATRAREIVFQPFVEQRVADLQITAGIGEGAYGLSVDGIQQDVVHPDLVDGPPHGILAQIEIRLNEAASGFTPVTWMKERVVPQLMSMRSGKPPLWQSF